MSGGLLSRRGGARTEGVDPQGLAWILALPLALVAAPLIALLAPVLGDLAFPAPSYHYWYLPPVVRKPAVQAGYLLALGAVAVYVVAILVLGRGRPRLNAARGRVLAGAAQGLTLALVVACWIAQRRLDVHGTTRSYFTLATILVAACGVLALVVAIARGVRIPSPAVLARSRALRAACFAAAVLVVVVWLLPAVYTDDGMAAQTAAGQLAFPAELFGNAYYFGEATALLNGRSPLVDMPAYGSLWPYVVALPFGALDGSYAAYTALMTAISGVALLAVYAVLRRIAGSLAALCLFVPFVATSCFIELGSPTWSYAPSTYFGVFPLRYAGPYLLAWLTARELERERESRLAPVLLFAAGGLVVANNLDFGLSALAATFVALLMTRRPLRLRRLVGEAAAGLVVAMVLLCALTLARAGSLPHLDLLTRYGRVFVNGGYGNIALRGLGWHVVLSLTFVAALATAAVRVAAGERERERERLLTGMLAWCGVFGLGASVYFYAYRSHPDVLVNLFSIWALTLALLVVVVLRTVRSSGRLPALPGLMVLFAFGLAVCSIAQLPPPWRQVERLADGGVGRPLELPAMTAIVAERTRPGEAVLVLTPVGHRVARAAGVVNVNPYPSFGQMPAQEQLDEALDALRDGGGRSIFVGQTPPPGMLAYLRRAGYMRIARRPVGGWSGEPILVLRR